jgi:hypothetical protein
MDGLLCAAWILHYGIHCANPRRPIACSELTMLTIRLIKGSQLMVLAKSSMPRQNNGLSWAIRWFGIAKVNRDLVK